MIQPLPALAGDASGPRGAQAMGERLGAYPEAVFMRPDPEAAIGCTGMDPADFDRPTRETPGHVARHGRAKAVAQARLRAVSAARGTLCPGNPRRSLKAGRRDATREAGGLVVATARTADLSNPTGRAPHRGVLCGGTIRQGTRHAIMPGRMGH